MEIVPEESDKISALPDSVTSSNVKKTPYLFFFVIGAVVILVLGIGGLLLSHKAASAACPEAAGQSLSPEEATIASEVPVVRTISTQNTDSSTQQRISAQGLSFDIPSQTQATIGSSSIYTTVTFGDKEITVLPVTDSAGITALDSTFAVSKCLNPKFVQWKGNANEYEEERNLLYLTPD